MQMMTYEETTIKTEPELIIDDTSSTSSNIVNETFHTIHPYKNWIKEIKCEPEDYNNKPQRQFQCDICNKYFDQKAAKKRHYLIVHTSERPFSCDICKNTFVDKSCVRNHMQQHIQHYCPICHEPFRHAFNIKRHMLVHNGLRPYNCLLCEKTYKHSSHLKRHLKQHEKTESWEDKKLTKRRKSKKLKAQKLNSSINV